MEQWTVQHRLFAYDAFVENSDSGKPDISPSFQCRSVYGAVSSRNTMLKSIETFRATGNIGKTKLPGLARTARTPENVAIVRWVLIRSTRRLARQRTRQLRMNCNSVRTVLRLDLKFHPYKMQVVRTRRTMQNAVHIRLQVPFEEESNAVVIISNTVNFNLNLSVNKQNFRYWTHQSRKNSHERTIYYQRVSLVCGSPFRCNRVVLFFKRPALQYSEHYFRMLNTCISPQLRRHGK